MSETIGSPLTGVTEPVTHSGTGGTAAPHLAGATRQGTETVQEAYSFACLNCGYGWEQGYDIEHHRARDGHLVIQYHANGVRVPSPLLKPTCPGCGGHTVRIMRAGRIATVEHSWHHAPGYAGHAEPDSAVPTPPLPPREHWWQLWRPRA
ncbi:hypothetical protein ACFW1A_37700 [Kitasatospora sp. NPDC058965]|uniref:hypothetical protein n=1 Tax=Kitasatospora sp. NPDC058965 TaxID=3346682 RepID=UPI0036A7574D